MLGPPARCLLSYGVRLPPSDPDRSRFDRIGPRSAVGVAIVALVIVVAAKRAARSMDPLQHPAENAAALHSVQLVNPAQYAGYGVPQYPVYALQYPPAGAVAGPVEPLSR